MAYLWQKVGMLAAILVSSVVMGFAPLGLKKVSPARKKRLLSYGNSFAGGVFFAIGFLHLLSESEDLMSETINPNFPLSYIMALIGFTGVFFVEKVVFAHHHHGGYSNMKDEEGDEKYGTFEAETHGHPPNEQSGVFAYILTFVLSIHSLISGVALGMDSKLSTLISLFVAIISHKWIEAFALGVAINKVQGEGSLARTLKLVLTYSAMEPLGIVIGLILSVYLSEDHLLVTQAFVLGIASGTFIYVAVVDILPAEFSAEATEKLQKFALVLLGLVAITIVVVVFTHDHDHTDSSDDDHDHDHDHESSAFYK